VVDIELADDGEEDGEEEEEEEVEEVEQGSLQGSWGGSKVEEEVVELDPVELRTSLYGKTPRIGALVVESSCLFILILDDIVEVGNSWQGEQVSKEIEQ